MGLSGNLNTMSFADLLQFISANVSSGTLQIRKGQVLKMIFFEKGKIISSSSSDPKDYLGHFLVAQGVISEDELRMAMEIQRSSKMLLGKILVMGGKVSEKDMTRLLQLKSEETIYSLFLWDEGEFTFYQDEFINRLFVRIALDPQSMIFEGTMRRDEWMRIRQAFPSNQVVLETIVDASLDLDEVDFQTRAVYEHVDGRRTIDDIAMATHCVDYQVCRSLYALYEKGYVRELDTKPAPGILKIHGGDHSSDQLLILARQELSKGRFEEALDVLRQIQPTAEGGYPPEVGPMMETAEKQVIEDIYKNSVQPHRVPRLLVPLEQLGQVQLTPEEGFILSRMDGFSDVRSILSITPMTEVNALRLLKKLLGRRIIGFAGEAQMPLDQ